MSISAHAVKELREKTNAGMMDCKKALQEAKGNLEGAVEILRKRGLALAQKKAGRTAKEGILGHYLDPKGKLGLLVEVNCETDFVVKTDDFQRFVKNVTELVKAKAPKDLEDLLKLPYADGKSVQETLTGLITKIGENIQIKNFVRWEAGKNEVLGFYLHAGSKIGVLVVIDDPSQKIIPDSAKQIAMHIAAMHPQYVRADEIPATVVEKEKEILLAGVDSKKPEEIREKIVAGKINKRFSEICLENQIFVKDPEGKTTVQVWLKNINPDAKIKRFVRQQVGE